MKEKIEALIKELEEENWELSKALKFAATQHDNTRLTNRFNLNLTFINKLKEIIK